MTWQTYDAKRAKDAPRTTPQSKNNEQRSIKNLSKINKNQWKICQKSIKNQSKIDQKSIKDRPKIYQKSKKIEAWGGLGASWGIFTNFLRILPNVDPILCDFGANMGPTWDPRWHQVGAKIDQKSMSKSIKKLKPLEIHFWEDFGRFLEAKWSQVGTRMGSKMELILKTVKIKKTL